MPPDKIDSSYFSPDILEFIKLLHERGVRYVVVGGEAVIHYGHARLTGDIDFFYGLSEENSETLFKALMEFWGGPIPELESVEELREPGMILQFGLPPNRIDLLNQIDGVNFGEAWNGRVTAMIGTSEGDLPVYYLGIKELLRNKEASGRPKDLDDLSFLKKLK